MIMKTKPVAMASIFMCGCLLQGAMGRCSADDVQAAAESSGKPASVVLTQLPMTFEAADADSGAVFSARGAGYRLALSASAASFYFPGGEMRVQLAGANPTARMRAKAPAPGRANYFVGSDPSLWRRQISLFSQVECASVYPGIDVVYRGTQRQLEYDFVVAPGADPGQIRLAFSNATGVEIDGEGNLVAHAAGGDFRHHRPVVYQEIDGRRQPVDAEFLMASDADGQAAAVRFKLGAYDVNRPLVIDPVLSFASFLGGSGDDQAFGVAVDRAGAIYVAGQTASIDFPTAKPFRSALLGGYDVFVAKYNPAGTALEYATYIGGSGVDRAFCLATDPDGNAVIAGVTFSTNFPTVAAFQSAFGGGDRDGFVMKLNPEGNQILFSTYLGGGGSDELAGAAVDGAGNICVGGHASSTNFPVFNAYQSSNRGKFDAVVAKFDPKGVLAFSTYMGGAGPYDCVVGITTDAADNILATGYTSSPDFPAVKPIQSKPSGGYDAFVSKFSPKGTELLFSSWIGGSGDDVGRSIAVDKSGAVYVSGDTFSTNFPMVKPMQKTSAGKRDVFISKLNLQIPQIDYSTYFGGTGEELASLAVDSAGCVHLVGLTTSRDLPSVNPIQAGFGGGEWDVFVAKLNATGSGLEFASYLGGSGNDQGASIALDGAGNIHIAGATDSPNFTASQPVQGKYGGGAYDALVAKITMVQPQSVVKEVVESQNKAPLAVAETPAPGTPATPVEKPAETPVAQKETTAAVAPTPAVDTNAVAKAVVEAPKSEPAPALIGSSIFGTNLVVNGSAELGTPAKSSYKSVPVPGWTTTTNLTVLRYGMAGGFPGTNIAAASGLGQHFFVGGADSEETTASQTIDLSASAALIDQLKAAFKCSAYLGGMAGQNDNASIQLVFRSADGAALGQATIGPVTDAGRQYKTQLLQKNVTGQVPAKTRSVELTLRMKRVQGAYNDAFADDIQFVVSEETPKL